MQFIMTILVFNHSVQLGDDSLRATGVVHNVGRNADANIHQKLLCLRAFVVMLFVVKL
jgi:hypothetical protein